MMMKKWLKIGNTSQEVPKNIYCFRSLNSKPAGKQKMFTVQLFLLISRPYTIPLVTVTIILF